MGPNNPWSPNWRPDPSGDRGRAIVAARRGGVLAGLAYVLIAASVLLVSPLPDQVALLALVTGLPGVALLGAGLAPSASGTRAEAAITGVAFAIGAPVAAVTSLVIGGLVLSAVASAMYPTSRDLAGPILRAGVMTAISVAPVIAVAAVCWVALVRRLATSKRGVSVSDPRPDEPGRGP